MMKKLFGIVFMLMLAVALMLPAGAADGVVMTVNGTEYTDHGTGWSAAVKLADGGTKATVVLHADWIADSATGFVCPDGGTKNGALYVGSGKVTLDLNGYTLDRNADQDAASYASSVLYVENCTFTVTDTSADAKGKITGGYAQYGGGIHAENSTLTFKNGNITGNKAEYGGGVYVSETGFSMEGGAITGNEAIYDGGGIHANFKTFTMKGGVIAGNHAGRNGGGYIAAAYGIMDRTTFVMNGGVFEENTADGEGGAVYLDYKAMCTVKSGNFRNNTANSHGGAMSCYFPASADQDTEVIHLSLNNVEFTGNQSLRGNGGAIFWNNRTELLLYNITITGNSAPNGFGGGIHANGWADGFDFSGKILITGNTAYTDRSDATSNFFIANEYDAKFVQNGTAEMSTDSRIGLTFGKVDLFSKTNLNYSHYVLDPNIYFTEEMVDCFFSDSPTYVINKEQRDDGRYDFFLGANDNPTFEGDPIFLVETTEGGKKEFFDRKSGWEYALEQSKTTNVKITLCADWIAPSGNFEYTTGAHNGALYLPRDCKKDITIDLNGYAIDRRRETPTRAGSVFYMDTNGSLTIMDSSAAQTGKITGGSTTKTPGSALFGLYYGGAFYVDYGQLFIKGGTITGNSGDYGGAIYCDDQDDAFVFINGGKIIGNTAEYDGGGIYMENGLLYVSGGEISGNTARNGAGIYWASDDEGFLLSGKIVNNNATEHGGVYVTGNGRFFLGGDIQITGNGNGNLYLSEKSADIHNAAGQVGAPNKPLTADANVYISAAVMEDEISGDDSCFGEHDFNYLHTDSSSYYIRAVYKADGGNHSNRLSINSWSHGDSRYPRVKTVSVKDSTLLESVQIDTASQTITLVARNNKKLAFQQADLYSLITYTCDKNTEYIYAAGETRDLFQDPYYKVMSDNGTYVHCKVNVVPAGGAWAENQDAPPEPYKMFVQSGETVNKHRDFGAGWEEALQLSKSAPTTITLKADWVAKDGGFSYSSGTDNGRLHLNDAKIDLTIDLNGHVIDRGLLSARSNGQIFKIDNGKLTITDSVGTGKITGAYNSGNGGAFLVEYGSLYIKGGNITGNKAANGAAIYGDDLDDVFVYVQGGTISGNTATEHGGAIYLYNGYLTVEGGEISGNTAKNGSGVYWESRNAAYFIGGTITGNTATERGGVYVEDYGKIYVGGDVVITDNVGGNLYLSDADANLYNAAGQDGAPNKPLTAEANIGISAAETEDEISGDNSCFGKSDFNYLHADSSSYYIRASYKADGGNHAYKLHINSWSHGDCRYPKVKTVSVKNSDLLESAELDYNTQVITLTAYSTKQKSFEEATLYNLINYTCDKDTEYIYEEEEIFNLLQPRNYRVMSDNGTYITCTVEVVPAGGLWAEEQDPATSPYRMFVRSGDTLNKYLDFGAGWADALQLAETAPTTITLNDDWIAKDGDFSYSAGTDSGRLELDDAKIDLTIDLNGFTISRNLTAAKSNGQVFKISDGKLTITDSVGTGKITGAYNTGDGGAFYVDYGSLYIKGGNITGNTAKNGAGIYCDDQDDAFVYVQGGKISGNTATENGGGIYVYEGYLTVEGGEISGNTAQSGGGVYWYSDNDMVVTGGKITGNTATLGGGVYTRTEMTMEGGEISGNTATENGGGIYGEDEKIYLFGGKITGNKAKNGAGIYWSHSDYIFLGNTVTGNEATERGGGIYLAGTADVFLCGTPVVDGNTSPDGADNVRLSTENNNMINGSASGVSGVADLADGAKIGLRTDFEPDMWKPFSTNGGRIRSGDDRYFLSDDPAYAVQGMVDTNASHPYKLYLWLVESEASAMKVTARGYTVFFNDSGKGWEYAVASAEDAFPTTVTLLADWTAENGTFDYSRGTENGYLHLDLSNIDMTLDLNGHTIDRGLTTSDEHGHVLKLEDGKLTITDSVGTGKITGGNVTYLVIGVPTGNGGGIYVDGGKLYLMGGNISGNYAYRGGGIYLQDGYIYMGGGKISQNTSQVGGGGIYAFDGELHIDGGIITENSAVGISSEASNKLYLTGGKITGNSGGGVWANYSNGGLGRIYIGGTVQIVENDRANLHLAASAGVKHACGQDGAPNKPLTEGANIRITTEVPTFSRENSMFGPNDHIYLHSDNPEYVIETVYVPGSEDHVYQLHALKIQKYMEVTIDDVTTTYDQFNKAWTAAIDAAEEGHPVTVKLLKDWTPYNFQYFSYDSGTENGYLHLNDADIELTLDLNGYTIDRGLTSATSDGLIFRIEEGRLIITDSVGTGKITGANNTGNGGAFLVECGSLYIMGGTITGNTAKYGAGIYCDGLDDASILLQGGKIAGNTATEDGGGIYMENGFLYMDDGEISGNTAVSGGGVYWNSRNAGCFTGGKITGNTATDNGSGVYVADWGKVYVGGTMVISGNENSNLYLCEEDVKIHNAADQEGVPMNPLTAGANIGITAAVPNTIISGEDSKFDENSHKYLHADDSDYTIQSVYDENGGSHAYKLYYNSTCVHTDANGDYACDTCGEYVLYVVTLLGYDAQTKTATVFVPEAGAYRLLFADYEGKALKHLDMVACTLAQGVNTVPQELTDFTLGSGDKVLLMQNLIPVCNALNIE